MSEKKLAKLVLEQGFAKKCPRCKDIYTVKGKPSKKLPFFEKKDEEFFLMIVDHLAKYWHICACKCNFGL